MMDVALLGTSGMMPLPDRFLTSLLVRINGKCLLIDCGEGTQVTMKMLGWGFKCIDILCLTHFHADHIAGLPGLLLTIGNSDRKEDLTIIGPKGLEAVVKCLTVIAPDLPFNIKFIELSENEENIVINDFNISALFLEHHIPCYGYSINLKRGGKFNSKKAKELEIPIQYWSKLQNNEEIIVDGKLYTPHMVLGEERKGIKVSYATDTRPIEALADFVRDSDLYIAEGIYGDDSKIEKAKSYKHMLFSEAANIASKAKVKELWLTHFSPSLKEPEEYLGVAADIFPNTIIGQDRMSKTIHFEN